MLTHQIGASIEALRGDLWEAHGTDLLLMAGKSCKAKSSKRLCT